MNQQIPNIGERVRQARMLVAKIKQIEAKHKEELAPYVKLKEQLKGILLAYLHDTNQKSAKTEYGSAGAYVRRTFSVADKSEFRRHVIGSEAWELLKWAVNPTAAQDFEEKNQTLPPGVKDSKIMMLSLTAPPKPKLKTVTSETENVEAEEVETL